MIGELISHFSVFKVSIIRPKIRTLYQLKIAVVFVLVKIVEILGDHSNVATIGADGDQRTEHRPLSDTGMLCLRLAFILSFSLAPANTESFSKSASRGNSECSADRLQDRFAAWRYITFSSVLSETVSINSRGTISDKIKLSDIPDNFRVIVDVSKVNLGINLSYLDENRNPCEKI